MVGPTKILFVEDSHIDLELIRRVLKKSDISFIDTVVETKENFEKALTSFGPDIIISDYNLPMFNGMQALRIRQLLLPLVPFILVTGANNEEIAVECMKAGADDYILKDNLTRLGQAVNAALTKYKFLIQKKYAEDALAESEELFRTAFENAAIGVCLIDTDLKYINANSTFCMMLGYSSDELTQLTFVSITVDEDVENCHTIVNDLNSGKLKTAIFEKRYIHKYGNTIWVNISIGKVFSPINNQNYYVAYVQDITDRKKTEEDLLYAKQQAEESDKLKTAFLHNISHEIRTPMNAIIGFSDLMKRKDLVEDKRMGYLDIIVQSCKQLLTIINDIVSIATIATQQEKVFLKMCNVNTIMRLLYDQYFNDSENKKINFSYTTELSNNEAIINTDETKVVQILSNLLNNAIKFTSEGFIKYGYSIKNDRLEFYVEDSGIGIPVEMHEKIFMSFRQVESSTSRVYGGTGLGLSIAKAYAELLGGKIWLKSEPEKGSTFYFALPWTKINGEDDLYATKENIIKLPDRIPRTILVAEDEDTNYMFLEEILSDQNIEIIRAKNGLESIEICKSNTSLDLVLMDIKMPVMNGLEATKQIKLFRPDLPIIAQTAYTSEIDKLKALAYGCDGFISKPIAKDKLLSLIEGYSVRQVRIK